MALFRIGDEYKIFDLSDKKFYHKTLTLSEEDYISYRDVHKYRFIITEKRIIYKICRGVHEIPNDFNNCIQYIRYNSVDNDLLIITREEIYSISKYNEIIYYDKIPRFENTTIPLKDKITKNEYKHDKFHIYYLDERYYFETDDRVIEFDHEDDRLVTHLYSKGIFICSVFRNNCNELMVTKRKILDHRKFYNHLLVQYKIDNTIRNYLILLCYASFNEFPYDDVPFKINTKSARKI